MAYFEQVNLADEEGTIVNPATEDSVQALRFLLSQLLALTESPRGYDKSLGRARGTVVVESGSIGTVGTVSTVSTVSTVTALTTVATVTNIAQLGNSQAQLLVNGQNLAAWAACVRARIT